MSDRTFERTGRVVKVRCPGCRSRLKVAGVEEGFRGSTVIWCERCHDIVEVYLDASTPVDEEGAKG